MQVFILPKHKFDELMVQKGISDDNVEEKTGTFFISINDSFTPSVYSGRMFHPHFSEDKKNVKVLFFDDVVPGEENTGSSTRAMSAEQAQELVRFIKNNEDKDTCIVHCAAGVSRSGAVGTFINDLFGEDFFTFKKRNPQVRPNNHVLRLLREAWGNI